LSEKARFLLFAPPRSRAFGFENGADPQLRDAWIPCERQFMRDTGRQGEAKGKVRREQRFARVAASLSPPCGVVSGMERVGARPYHAVEIADAASSAASSCKAGWAESTCSASAVHAPCARRDGDPVVAWKGERRLRLRGDKVERRFLEEMRGFELVGTSSAAAPPGRVRATLCAEIAMGSDQT